jgi:hypothetical protein
VKDKLLCERGGGDRRVAACLLLFRFSCPRRSSFSFSFSVSVSLLRRIFCFDFQNGNPAFLVRLAEDTHPHFSSFFHAIIIHRLVFLTFLLLTSKISQHTPITLITKGLKDLQKTRMLDERKTQRASPRSPNSSKPKR